MWISASPAPMPRLARERDAYFVTFNIQEGQQFRFGEITTVSEMEGVESEEFQAAS